MSVTRTQFRLAVKYHLTQWIICCRRCEVRSTWQRSWLGHCATSRKVTGSSPDDVIGFFNLPNPSSHTIALGSTRPLTETSTRNLPGCKGRPACKADNLTANCKPIFYKMWEPRRLTTLWAFTACYRNSFTF
jgi:hypothetical protein